MKKYQKPLYFDMRKYILGVLFKKKINFFRQHGTYLFPRLYKP